MNEKEAVIDPFKNQRGFPTYVVDSGHFGIN